MAVLLTGASLRAAAAPNPPVTTEVTAHAERKGRHVHDGFYLRLGTGFGAYDERLSSETTATSPEIEGRNRGIATLGELSIGGTVGDGWVVGGGIYSLDVLATTYKAGEGNNRLPPGELDPELRNVALIGPFFDRYPDPRIGFHYQLALGLATLTPRVFGHSGTERSEYLSVGGGLMLGVGYEWWVDDELSLGVLSRTTAAVLSGKDDSDRRWLHVAIASPGLLITLTYH